MSYKTAKQKMAHNKKLKQEHWVYLQSLGYKSKIFKAQYSGGKCGLSGLLIKHGDEVAYFKNYGLCHVVPITNHIREG